MVTIALVPTYIPIDVCATVGQDPAKTTVDQCMATVVTQVGKGGVSAAADVPELQKVVGDAKSDGLDLKIVVLPTNPWTDPPMRDIATEVGKAYPGSTVLALSPAHVGSYSTSISRVTLEAGEDVARTGNPVQSAKNFVSQVSTPLFPWTEFTIVVIVGVVLAAIGTRALQVRARKAAAVEAVENSE